MKTNHILLAAVISVMGNNAMYSQDYKVKITGEAEPMMTGKFEPTWESLKQYEVPEWFKNVKFGIWAHWGPQCVEGSGDWMARKLYIEGSDEYKYHCDNYGHPSEVGFKDILPMFKAENWNPDKLVEFYKKVGAQYFFALGNHHDNFDLWDSKHQEWNSMNIGPKRDILAEWEAAARKHGLYFGVSFHAEHAWRWYETAQRYDMTGDKAGVQYDGNLTKADGKGKWWDGLDPQNLYAQRHPLSELSWTYHIINGEWDWQNGVNIPDAGFCANFYDRTVDAINRYNPDLVYFDCAVAPLYPISDAGLKIAAHYYNHSIATHDGKLQAVMFGKWLSPEQSEAMVWDVERGSPNSITDRYWQSCSCIGDWHYKTSIYQNNEYKSAVQVVKMLVDIISKNGKLLLSVPLRGDGTFDEKEEHILTEFGKWMDVNKESIYDTTPWSIYGEGPIADKADPTNNNGFNEWENIMATDKEIRFSQSDKYVYATALDWPSDRKVSIRTLATAGKHFPKKISKVELVGYGKIPFERTTESLNLTIPDDAPKSLAPVFRIRK